MPIKNHSYHVARGISEEYTGAILNIEKMIAFFGAQFLKKGHFVYLQTQKQTHF